MNDPLFQRVKHSLNAQYYTMNDSWLRDCIEYYVSENDNPRQEEVLQFVISQWLLSDLREINNETGCLPRTLSERTSVLPKKYILQMDMMYDISVSKYKQMEKIRKVNTVNIDETEKDGRNDEFQNQPKSKRMMQLALTDGVQNVLAIEYQPIRLLKDVLLPGFKVMIKGPVRCRRGVLLLEETNFQEVGGEVESLLIKNAIENIFARALKLEENPDPYNDAKDTIQTQMNMAPPARATAANSRPALLAPPSSVIDDDFCIDDFDAIDQIERQCQPSNNQNSKQIKQTISKTINKPTKPTKPAVKSKDTFMEDDDCFIAMIDESTISTSTQNTSKPVVKQNVSNDIVTYDLTDADEPSCFSKPLKKSTTQVDFLKPSISKHSQQSWSSLKSNSVKSFSSKNFEFADEDYNDSWHADSPKSTNKNSVTSKDTFGKSTSGFPDKHEWDDFSKSLKTSEVSKSNIGKLSATSRNLELEKKGSNSKILTSNESEFPDDDFDFNDVVETVQCNSKNDFDDWKTEQFTVEKAKSNVDKLKSSAAPKSLSSNSMPKEFSENEFKDDFKLDLKSNQKTNINTKMKSPIKHKGSLNFKSLQSRPLPTNPVGTKRPASEISPPPSNYQAHQKVRCVETTPKIKSANKKITDFLKKTEAPTSSPPKICDFISEVLSEPETESPRVKLLRGKVMSMVKLNIVNSRFYLEGKITDGTGKLDIIFASEVLEKIIGLSVQEFMKKRKQSKQNPALKEELRKVLKKAQESLQVMDTLMNIELSKGSPATVVLIQEMTEDQKKLIESQVQKINETKKF